MERTLAERLDAIRSAFQKKAPPEAQTIMHAATQALVDAGRAESALGVGDKAPEFELTDTQDHIARSAELLERGPLVLTFFRGHW